MQISPRHALLALKPFLPRGQFLTLEEFIADRDQFYCDKVVAIAQLIASMPATGEARGEAEMVYLHYFRGSIDCFITEKDAGAPGDEPSDFQTQAFGLTKLDPGAGELGYISIPALVGSDMELDLHWTPIPLAQVREEGARKS